MVWIVSLLGFLAVFAATISLSVVLDGRTQVRERLSIIKETGADEEEDKFKLPFNERVIKPFYEGITNFIERIAPREIKNNLAQTLEHGGNPWNLNVNSLVVLQLGAGFVVFVATWFIFSFVVGLVLGAAAFMLPYLVVSSKAKSRKEAVLKSLPDYLDMLYVSVEAGLGFDMALKKVSEQMPGALSDEFNRALEEIQVGRTRADALRNINKRVGVEDLNTFINSIIQAEQLGSNIGNTLRVQSEVMRRKRRQRAEQNAMKAPIKMLFPIVFFIFPALFVVILGPAGINIMQVLTDMF